MGMGTNILVFLVLLSFFLQAIQADSYSTVFSQLIGVLGSGNSPSDLFSNIFVIGGLTAVTAVVGTFVFPNPYASFAPLVAFLLFGFTFPIGMFDANSGIDYNMRMLISGLFVLLYLLAVVSWWKGGDTP